MKALSKEIVLTVIDMAKYRDGDERLLGYLRKLPQDQLAELMALMWLGRDNDDPDKDYAFFVEHAKRNMDHAAYYVFEKQGSLPTYLRDGLRKLRRERGK